MTRPVHAVRRTTPLLLVLAALGCSSGEGTPVDDRRSPAEEPATSQDPANGESPASAENPDAKAIRQVIASAYIEGLHENGSRGDIRAGFHPDFVMKVLTEDGLTDVTIEEWIARLPAEDTPPERTITHRVPEVSVSGVAAVARVEVLFDGKQTFTDYMSLYKFGDDWRIVAKIFNREN